MAQQAGGDNGPDLYALARMGKDWLDRQMTARDPAGASDSTHLGAFFRSSPSQFVGPSQAHSKAGGAIAPPAGFGGPPVDLPPQGMQGPPDMSAPPAGFSGASEGVPQAPGYDNAPLPGGFGSTPQQGSGMAGDSPTMPSGPTHSAKMGGDTYTRTPADWAAEFSKAAQKAKGAGGGGGKAAAKGAAIEKTGTLSNPSANMDDDGDLENFRKAIDKFEKRPREMNLKPLLALTDSWTGSELAQSYTAPMTNEQHEANILALREKLYEKSADLKYKKAYLSQRTEQAHEANAFRRDQLAQQEKLALLRNAAIKAGKAGAAGGFGTSKGDKARDAWIAKPMTRKMLEGLAINKYGKRDEDGNIDLEKSGGAKIHGYELGVEAWEYGKYREENGFSKPGMGLHDALAEFATQGSGPDGAGGG